MNVILQISSFSKHVTANLAEETRVERYLHAVIDSPNLVTLPATRELARSALAEYNGSSDPDIEAISKANSEISSVSIDSSLVSEKETAEVMDEMVIPVYSIKYI